MTDDRRRFSIRTVLVAWFVLVAALPIAFLSVQRYLWLSGELFRQDLEQDAALARAVAAGLNRYMTARVHLIETLADDLGARGLEDARAVTAELDTVRRRNPAFRGLFALDPRGVTTAASPALDSEGQPNLGKRLDDRPWFQQAVSGSPRSYDVIVSRVQVGRPGVVVAAPIRSRAGQVLGVVAGGLNLDDVRRSVREVDPQGSDLLVVADGRGRVIVHWSPQWENEAKDLSEEQVFRDAKRREAGSTEYVSLFSGTTRWGSYVRVPSAGWVVWVSRGPETLRLQTQRVLRDLILSGLVAVLIASGAALVMSRLLARPLSALAHATRRMTSGAFQGLDLLPQRRFRIQEFDDLVVGFREMAAALRLQYDELEAKVAERTEALAQRTREAQATAVLLRAQEEIRRGYGELAALLNSLDRSHILEEGTKKIAATLHAPLAAVYLSENGPAALRLKTYAALDPAGLDTALLSPAGLPAEAARRDALLVVSPAQSAEPLRLQTGLGGVDVAAVAALPLRHQDRSLGVLAVALLEPLTEGTRSFLENAARQLSVALSNAGLFESVRFQSQQLERLNVELQGTSEVKSEFLASMSHELRTPLNSIIGFTELLLASPRDPLSDRQRTALEKVHASGKHLLSLINDVLDLSKIEAGRMEVRPEPFALAALVRECLGAVEPQVQGKGLSLRAVGLETAPELVQDRGKVKQIVLNLLANAVKFTAAGWVEVRVTARPDEWIALAVADTGPGIRPEDQAAIFESFRQVDSSPARAAGGTGLGLAISRRLAGLLGGTLTVECEPGHGSVFALELPARYDARPPARELEEEPGPPPGATPVLVIDDDRDVVDIIREALEGEPLWVDWAPSAAAGLARARRFRPAVILLDVILQEDSDGWDVLRALKTDPTTRDIPVVVHSVIDNPQRARELGADSVLPKPASTADLKTRLRLFVAGGPPA